MTRISICSAAVRRQIASRVIAEWMRIDRESDFSAERRFQLSDGWARLS